MELLKTSTEWARTELFSTSLFILFGTIVLLVSIGFWQIGKTDIAKAYVIPTLVAGALLLIIGLGLTYTNYSRITEFEQSYNANIQTFLNSEIARAEATLKEYKTVVFTAIPLIISLSSLLIIFINNPAWRASLITTISMMAIILLIDGTAHNRMEIYYEKLVSEKTT